MSKHCVNINTIEFEELYSEVSDIITKEVLAAKISLWQESNGLDNFPALEDLNILPINEVDYNLKAVEILSSNKAKQVFEKGEKNNWDLNKILSELQVPKEQKQIILDSQKTTELLDESKITYTDEEGNPCAKKGLTNAIKGSNWKLVKDFKGKPKHSQGGVDISISDKGVSMRRGGKDIKAAHGLLIAANGLVLDNNPEYESMSKVITNRNKDLDWVDRAINPDKYPIDNQNEFTDEGGKIISHRLAYATGDEGEAYVYPTVIYKDGRLIQLSDNEAMENSMREGQSIKIPNTKLAEYYSQNGLIKH
jgi:hypothetical protein